MVFKLLLFKLQRLMGGLFSCQKCTWKNS